MVAPPAEPVYIDLEIKDASKAAICPENGIQIFNSKETRICKQLKSSYFPSLVLPSPHYY